jgi:hypothetical protein
MAKMAIILTLTVKMIENSGMKFGGCQSAEHHQDFFPVIHALQANEDFLALVVDQTEIPTTNPGHKSHLEHPSFPHDFPINQ